MSLLNRHFAICRTCGKLGPTYESRSRFFGLVVLSECCAGRTDEVEVPDLKIGSAANALGLRQS